MTAPADHRRCCRRAAHAEFTTGEQADAHQDRNARVDVANAIVWPAVIIGTALTPLVFLLWWRLR